MKYSSKPTSYIVVKAERSSEYDYCSFAIIHSSPVWLVMLRQRVDTVDRLKKEIGFSQLSYSEAPEGFFNDDHEQIDWKLLDAKKWIYVELNQQELETLKVSESSLDNYQLILTEFGTVRYEANGKHSGERFWTADINIRHLFES